MAGALRGSPDTVEHCLAPQGTHADVHRLEGTMGTTNGTKDLKQKLSQYIDAARAKLDALKADLSSMRDEDLEALRSKRAEIDKRLDEQRAKAQQLQSDIANWKQEKVAHTQDAINSWRKKHELK